MTVDDDALDSDTVKVSVDAPPVPSLAVTSFTESAGVAPAGVVKFCSALAAELVAASWLTTR